MVVIQNMFGFVKCDTSMHNHVDTLTIQGIPYNYIMLGLVVNALTIIFGCIRLKVLSLEINENVSIPWIRQVDEE